MRRFPKSLYRSAIATARENGTLPDRNSKSVSNRSEASRVRSNQSRALIRKTKYKLRSARRREIWARYKAGEDISRIEYRYEAGDLVMNTTISHGRRTPESCGLIVETDTDRLNGTHRILKVMCPAGLQHWDAAKCIPVPSDEEE